MGFLSNIFKKKAAPDPLVQAPAATAAAPAEQDDAEVYDAGLEKTRTGMLGWLGKAIAGKSTVDEDFLDELEMSLISADVGVDTTIKIIEKLRSRVARDKYVGVNELRSLLRQEMAALLEKTPSNQIRDFELPHGEKPYVIMVVGVNGVGKTTTIGKLANRLKNGGYSVVLGAADTFRAAAVDQLTIWSQRADVPIVSRGMNADPASVAFDTVQSAKAKGADVVIIDTAGRLHNKIGLMNELAKIKTSISKLMPDAPHETLLVLDGSTGQNAIEQAKQFSTFTQINALALTKLDGTAKGGVVLAIADQLKIPVKYIGLGEGINDLQAFDKAQFVQSLFA